jgi:hypothetical protein
LAEVYTKGVYNNTTFLPSHPFLLELGFTNGLVLHLLTLRAKSSTLEWWTLLLVTAVYGV